MKLVSNAFTSEAFQLYKRYQMRVHHDTAEELTPRQYERFLCSSPLVSDDPALGSFHLQYRIDGQLVAVSVIDVLPACVSGVYAFFVPDLSFLSLGTLTALKEIDQTRELQRTRPSLRFYYMGYYIHSCAKMRYKGRFEPSRLLCPERFTWHYLSRCVAALDREKYVVLSELPEVASDLAESKGTVDSGEGSRGATPPIVAPASVHGAQAIRAFWRSHADQALREAPVVRAGQLIRFSELAPGEQAQLRAALGEYAFLVGPELARRIAIRVD
jgi:arginine-tRNA-protein transferase